MTGVCCGAAVGIFFIRYVFPSPKRTLFLVHVLVQVLLLLWIRKTRDSPRLLYLQVKFVRTQNLTAPSIGRRTAVAQVKAEARSFPMHLVCSTYFCSLGLDVPPPNR